MESLWQSCEGMVQYLHSTIPWSSPICFMNIPPTLFATPVLSCSSTRARFYPLKRYSRPGKLTFFFPFRERNPTVVKIRRLLVGVKLILCSSSSSSNGVELWGSPYPTNCSLRFCQVPCGRKTYRSLGGGATRVLRWWRGWNLCTSMPQWQPSDLLVSLSSPPWLWFFFLHRRIINLSFLLLKIAPTLCSSQTPSENWVWFLLCVMQEYAGRNQQQARV